MEECVFCRIARGEIPVELLWNTPAVAAFRDANPQAPVHVLIVPKRHIPSLDALKEEDGALVGELSRARGRGALLPGLRPGAPARHRDQARRRVLVTR